MSVITPTNQNVSINNSENRIFDYNNVNSRFYLGRTSNSLLRVFGDCVVDGLEVEANYTNVNELTFTVTKGTAIIDGTMVDFKTDNTITFDINGLDSANGYLVINISFLYVFISKKNEARLHCHYITNAGVVPDDTWFIDRNHLVLDQFIFDTTEQSVSKQVNPEFNPIILSILGKDYEVRKRSVLEKRIKRLIGYTL